MAQVTLPMHASMFATVDTQLWFIAPITATTTASDLSGNLV